MLQALLAAGPLISAGSNLAGSLLQSGRGNAAAQAQAQANNVALLNWLENRRNSNFQRELATASQTNARGDTTGYVPGVGFVTTPSAFTRGMQDLEDRENVAGFVVDQPRAREEQRNAFLRRLGAGADADAARAGMGVGRQSQRDIEAGMIETGFAEADSGADELRNAIGINAIRTGSGGEVALGQAARNALANRRVALARARAGSAGETVRARGAQNAVAEEAIAAPMRRAAGGTNARLAGGAFEGLNRNSGAAAELASRFLQRAGQVETPRLGYADDRTALNVAGVGRSLDNFLTEIGRLGKQRPDVPQQGGLY